MSTFFDKSLIPVLKKIIEEFKDQGKVKFFTIDVIRKQTGKYHNDKTSAVKSINANYGKFLKLYSNEIGILEIRSGVKVKDDFGVITSSSEWKIL